MAFSYDIKNEISQLFPDQKCCMLAEISGFLRTCGSVKLRGLGKMEATIATENAAAARSFVKMLKKYFDFQIKTDLNVTNAAILKTGHLITLTIPAEMNAAQILRETGILSVKEGYDYITEGISQEIVKKKCCKKAYIRGAFLGGGSMSDPEKGYHLEIVCGSEILALDLKRLINGFGLNAKVTKRKSKYIVYLKEADQIADLLNILGAHGKLLDFENIRVMKDIKNQANRAMNCDTANIDKTIYAAQEQIQFIQLIEKKKGLKTLPDKLREIAELRLEYQEDSLTDLGLRLNPQISKSGVNHRMKKLEKLAKELDP